MRDAPPTTQQLKMGQWKDEHGRIHDENCGKLRGDFCDCEDRPEHRGGKPGQGKRPRKETPSGIFGTAWEASKSGFLGPIGSAWNQLKTSARDTKTVWTNTGNADMSLPGRVYATGGTVLASQVGLRQVNDAYNKEDAVDAHKQSTAENVLDGVTGVISMGITVLGIKGLLPGGGRAATAVDDAVESAQRAAGGPCFAAGTPMLIPEGSRPIEKIRAGDWVLARPEDDPESVPSPRLVEATFQTYSPVMHLGGQIIHTTTEHRFWVLGRNSTATHQWTGGVELLNEDGSRGPFGDLDSKQRAALKHEIGMELQPRKERFSRQDQALAFPQQPSEVTARVAVDYAFDEPIGRAEVRYYFQVGQSVFLEDDSVLPVERLEPGMGMRLENGYIATVTGVDEPETWAPPPSASDYHARRVLGTVVRAGLCVFDLLVNGQSITTTPGHPFWSVDRHCWVRAGELRVGERLRTSDGLAVAVEEASPLRWERIKLYNVEVEEYHTYFVGSRARGSILVHNGFENLCGVPKPASVGTEAGSAPAIAPSRVASNPKVGRLDFEHPSYDKALESARRNAGDLGSGTKKMFDPETGTLIGEMSADGKKGWRIDVDHANYWDWAGGKKGAGGKYGHDFFPPSQSGPHSKHIGYAPWEG